MGARRFPGTEVASNEFIFKFRNSCQIKRRILRRRRPLNCIGRTLVPEQTNTRRPSLEGALLYSSLAAQRDEDSRTSQHSLRGAACLLYLGGVLDFWRLASGHIERAPGNLCATPGPHTSAADGTKGNPPAHGCQAPIRSPTMQILFDPRPLRSCCTSSSSSSSSSMKSSSA